MAGTPTRITRGNRAIYALRHGFPPPSVRCDLPSERFQGRVSVGGAFCLLRGRSAKANATHRLACSLPVPGESTRQPVVCDRIERLLAELHDGYDEADRFFTGMFDQLDRLCLRLGQQSARSPAPVDNKLQKQILDEQNQGARELQRMGHLLEEIAERLAAAGILATPAAGLAPPTKEKCR